MIHIARVLLLCISLQSVKMVKIHRMLNLPLANIIIDANKGFVLRRIGTYSSHMEEAIIHTFIPFDNLCTVSSKTNICQYVSQSTITNILELNTVMAAHHVAHSQAPYDSERATNVIGHDLIRTLTNHRPNQVMREKNNIFHLVDGNLQMMKDSRNSVMASIPFDSNNNNATIRRLLPKPSAIIQEQILNKRIGFEFLTNDQLKYLIKTVLSSIDGLNEIYDLRESLAIFFQLIIAQSTYALRSCSINIKDTEMPCFVVSTLFVRPSLESTSRYSVYRLTPLPTVVNGSKYTYSNLPWAIGFNTESQSLIIWENESDQKQCIFSLAIQCDIEPLPIPLSSSPCLSELLSQETLIASACQVSRTKDIHSGLMNIASGIWYFYDTNTPMYCQSRGSLGESSTTLSTNEPTIIFLACRENITCANVELISNACANPNIVVRTGDHEIFQRLTSTSLLLKNLTKKIISIYQTAVKDEIIEMLDKYNGTNKIWKNILQEFSTASLSGIFFILISLILFIITCLRRTLQKRVDILENDIFEIVHTLNKDTD